MTFKELIQATGALLGLEEFAPDEEGFCSLEAEEGAIDITCVPEAHDLVLLHAVVGKLPVSGTEQILSQALEANCGFLGTNQATLSVNPDTDCIELARFFPLELLEPAAFLAYIESFAATLMKMRGLLKVDEVKGQEPLDEEEPKASSVSEEMREMGNHGYLRV